jgi:hypothetical protein
LAIPFLGPIEDEGASGDFAVSGNTETAMWSVSTTGETVTVSRGTIARFRLPIHLFPDREFMAAGLNVLNPGFGHRKIGRRFDQIECPSAGEGIWLYRKAHRRRVYGE